MWLTLLFLTLSIKSIIETSKVLSFLEFEFAFVVRWNRFCYVCSGAQVHAHILSISHSVSLYFSPCGLYAWFSLRWDTGPNACIDRAFQGHAFKMSWYPWGWVWDFSRGSFVFGIFLSVLLEGELFDCVPSALGHLLDLACLGSRLLQGPSVPLSVQPCVTPSVKSLRSWNTHLQSHSQYNGENFFSQG